MALWRDLEFVWKSFLRSWRKGWKWWLAGVLTFGVLTSLVLFPNDLKLLRWVQGPEGLEGVEKQISFWGDFLQFNIAWGVVMFAMATMRGDRWLRRAAVAFVLAGVLSGATTRVVKFSAGRARPKTVERLDLQAVSFRGPSTSGKFHGYWSGHTAASVGSAVALVVVLPRVGWVAILFAGTVGWARLYGNHHFPADVLHGATWGVMWGFLVGGGMVKVRKRAEGWGRRFQSTGSK